MNFFYSFHFISFGARFLYKSCLFHEIHFLYMRKHQPTSAVLAKCFVCPNTLPFVFLMPRVGHFIIYSIFTGALAVWFLYSSKKKEKKKTNSCQLRFLYPYPFHLLLIKQQANKSTIQQFDIIYFPIFYVSIYKKALLLILWASIFSRRHFAFYIVCLFFLLFRRNSIHFGKRPCVCLFVLSWFFFVNVYTTRPGRNNL